MKNWYSHHPDDVKNYTTEKLRNQFLMENVFVTDEVNTVYSHVDRIIFGGVMPITKKIKLEATKELASKYFLERRELGVINVGGKGQITVDGINYPMDYKDAIYIGRGSKDITFESNDEKKPAKYYINSCPAHKEYETVHIPFEKAIHKSAGDDSSSNKRTINQFIHPDVCKSCQLSMGLTELAEGNVWNTMPSHTHERRMEVYFYFNMKEETRVFHMMGQPNETRHIVMKEDEAVVSPSWSIHSGVGTSNYSFIWGMCGENQDFDDMDFIEPQNMK